MSDPTANEPPAGPQPEAGTSRASDEATSASAGDDTGTDPQSAKAAESARRRRILAGIALATLLLSVAGFAIWMLTRGPERVAAPQVQLPAPIEPVTAPTAITRWEVEPVPSLRLHGPSETPTAAFTDDEIEFEMAVRAASRWGTDAPYEVELSPPVTDSVTGTTRIPTLVPKDNDCFSGPLRPPAARTPLRAGQDVCRFTMAWAGTPGETMQASVRVTMAAFGLTDLSEEAERTRETPWDRIAMAATVHAIHEAAPTGALRAIPDAVRLTRDGAATIALRPQTRAIRVQAIEPEGAGLELVDDTCLETLDPRVDDASCTATVRAAGDSAEPRGTIRVRWRAEPIAGDEDPPEQTTNIAVRVTMPTARPTRPAALEPAQIDFGRVTDVDVLPAAAPDGEPQTAWAVQTRYVTIDAGSQSLEVISAASRAHSPSDEESVRANLDDCRTAGLLPPDGTCEMRVLWQPQDGQRLKAELIISVRRGADAPRERLRLPVTGRVAGATSAAEMGHAQARQRHSEARPANPYAAGTGRVVNPKYATETMVITAPQWIERDYTSVGEEPLVSTRPVPGHKMVMRNTFIRAVLDHKVDSRGSGQVTATVDQDVFAAHGRGIIIPRGSKLLGSTGSTDAGDLRSAAEGDSEDLGGGPLYGRMHFDWQFIRREDGSMFPVAGQLHTTDRQGLAGVPGTWNTREAQRWYAAAVGAIGTYALTRWLNDEEVTTTTRAAPRLTAPGGTDEDGENDDEPEQQTVTSETARSRAATELVDKIRETSETLLQFNIESPTLSVAAGTQFAVKPAVDLWIRPATGHTAIPVEYPVPVSRNLSGRAGTTSASNVRAPIAPVAEEPVSTTGRTSDRLTNEEARAAIHDGGGIGRLGYQEVSTPTERRSQFTSTFVTPEAPTGEAVGTATVDTTPASLLDEEATSFPDLDTELIDEELPSWLREGNP